ncbi:MAG: iron ABC transporter permease [Candidatus Methanomethylicia archaeon]|nr:iron ABC transporter permease [Candidatus Methanomethylicia archaeon]MCX8168910.1 iron ABC transporter permease [Candidatus Methanomethylicia archaeon]
MNRSIAFTLLLSLVNVIFILLSILFIGRLPLSLFDWINWSWKAQLAMEVRLPRVLYASLAGAALGVSGSVMQSLFRNPLASPDILGASSGSAFGASLGILFFTSAIYIEGFSFSMGLLSLITTMLLSRTFKYGDEVLRLILSGIAVSALFNAGVGYVKYVADPYSKLPHITFWLLGSFGRVGFSELYMFSPFIVLSIVLLILLSWRINVLSLGDEVAKSLGVNPMLNRLISIVFSVLSVSSIVCVTGIIGWLGLITPHLVRPMVGADNRKVIVNSALLGSILSIISDNISRSLIEAEIPFNIIVSFISIPLFIIILRSGVKSGS